MNTRALFDLHEKRMSLAEFWALPETNQPIELINGAVIVRPCPSPRHQWIVGRILLLLDRLIPEGKVIQSPIGLYLDDENLIQPEISWIAANSRCVVTPERLEGSPDLVVEMFSLGWVLHDRKVKFNLYQRFGVREYWMVDPDEQYVEVWRFENGIFVHQGVYGPDEAFVSAVLGGKTVELKAVFAP